MNDAATGGSAARRARWLAEVAEALQEARWLTDQLAMRDLNTAIDLNIRIDLASAEVESLRLRAGARPRSTDFDPEWIENLGWRQSA